VFGVWRSGNTLVSLPYPGRGADLAAYAGQVIRMAELAEVPVIMVDAGYRALLPPDLPVEIVTYQEAAQTGGPRAATDGSGGLVQFTSGSLGRPKGVLIGDRALAANMRAIMDAAGALDDGATAVSWLPLSHDMGFVGMFLTCVAAFGPRYDADRLVLQTPESFLADPASWLRTCSRFGASVTTAPNFAFDLSVRARPLLADADLSALRVCITGAERVQAPTLRRFTDAFAANGLRPEVVCPAYGMAEAALAVTMVRAPEHWRELSLDRAALAAGRVRPAVGEGAVGYVSNGAPVAGLEVRVVPGPDEPGREVGEVQIRGDSLFGGYLGAERRLTADGWFPTRDLGFLRDGELFLVGRADETIIVGGRNHYAADIESAVGHELVRAGCLAAVPLDTGYALLAEPVAGADPQGLPAACRELARIAARRTGIRPSMVGFLPRGRIPKTPSGKLQRLALAAAIAAGTLDPICAVWPEGRNR
jgi:acyl-CoA synthetase (AMP-forming)/AMP-acid ligase II